MLKVEDVEKIRRAYFREGMSIREIGRTLHHSRRVIRRAIESADPGPYQRVQERPAPVLGPWKEKIDGRWDESQKMPRKQRYPARKIYQELPKQGYNGSEVTVSRYMGQKRRASQAKQVFLPLEFDPGEDAQVDWGEAVVEIAGERVVVQRFIMRLNYSHARFVMVFPLQQQEAFFAGHIQAFHFFGAGPKRITYDNLKTAVYRILTGRHRTEPVAFVALRSHYLFESRYCTPGQGHEKGGVESDVGFAQRNFMVPMPKVGCYAELNAVWCAACLRDLERRVRGGPETGAEKLATEKPWMLEWPKSDYKACRQHLATVNP